MGGGHCRNECASISEHACLCVCVLSVPCLHTFITKGS